MHRFWTNGTLVACAVVVVCGVGCGEQPLAVGVRLVKQDEATSYADVECLKVIVREEGSNEPAVFGPFEAVRDQQIRLGAEVTPGTDFTLDVQGCAGVGGDNPCPSTTCGDAEILARGCVGPLSVSQPDQYIDVTLFRIADWPGCVAIDSQ